MEYLLIPTSVITIEFILFLIRKKKEITMKLIVLALVIAVAILLFSHFGGEIDRSKKEACIFENCVTLTDR